MKIYDLFKDVTPVRIYGTYWTRQRISRNMTLWRHDLVRTIPGADLHITVCFRDRAGRVQNGPIDHHSTLFLPGSKYHYGWKYGDFAEPRDSPHLESQILLFELFKHERHHFYDNRVINRMYS